MLRLVRRGGNPGIAQPTAFGRLLQSLRISAGLTQEELAEGAGLSQKAISAYERGQRTRPRPRTVRLLADALGLAGHDREAFVKSVDAGLSVDGGRLTIPFAAGRVPPDALLVDAAERSAAWELYIELVTRTAVSRLGPNDGLLREAIDSLYTLFETARGILRRHGPLVAQVNGERPHTFGGLALDILNDVLRPLLSEWHPLLLHYESQRAPRVSAVEHERAWARNEELREVLAEVRGTLDEYAEQLAMVAGVSHPLNGVKRPTG
jgi:transcriptional regulator with XRE-family HTH domain